MNRLQATLVALALAAAGTAAQAQTAGVGDSPAYPGTDATRVAQSPATRGAAFAGGPTTAGSDEPEYLVKGDALVPNPAWHAQAPAKSRAEARRDARDTGSLSTWRADAFYRA